MGNSTALTAINRLQSALTTVVSIGDVKDIRDKAEALRVYLRNSEDSLAAQNRCAECKLRAERRGGEILRETEKHKGGRPGKNRFHDGTSLNPETLDDLGVTKKQSHRWQAIASVPEQTFEARIAEMIAKGEQDGETELTSAVILSIAKRIRQAEKVANDKPQEGCTLDDLQTAIANGWRYGTIYADPPWPYGNQATRASTDNHYATMSLEDIAALPIPELAADESHLHLWTTNGFLHDAIHLLEGWGFEFKSVFVWVKPQMGLGNYWRVSHEFLLLGVRGKQRATNHEHMSWLSANREKHSKKPEQIRKLVESVSPGPRLELFGRSAHENWHVWGNEVSRDMFAEKVKAR